MPTVKDSPEPRRRKKDYDSLRSVDRERERPKPSRQHSSKSKSTDLQVPHDTLSSKDSATSSTKGRKVQIMVPEMDRRRSSLPEPRPSYPSFSKAHSKEAVNSREDVSSLPYTPDPTDLSRLRSEKSASPRVKTAPPRNNPSRAPPSPPLTATDAELRRAKSGSNIRSPTETRSSASKPERLSSPRVLKASHFSASRNSLREAEEGERCPVSDNHVRARASFDSRSPSPVKHVRSKSKLNPVTGDRTTSQGSVHGSAVTDSDATSIAPGRKKSRKPPTLLSHRGDSPASHSDPSPRTPPASRNISTPLNTEVTKDQPATGVRADRGLDDFAPAPPPPPPPPPPPAVTSVDVPRVDYLLQHGGLARMMSKSFSPHARLHAPQVYQQYMSPALGAGPKATDLQDTFAPYRDMLDNLATVMSKSGSVAVATGYRSVARRLLERLEAVFARNISSEACRCAMCQLLPENESEDTGVSWGEILELVSGRSELPAWPPFSLDLSTSGLGIAHLENQEAPMQKLDIDVPEEYREHYIRQSKKTKTAVQNWLAAQPESEPPAPPQEVDDETLTFAMLTYMEPHERRIFTALARDMSSIPTSRAPTPAQPAPGQKSELMCRVGLALQRLYRLPSLPREPECCMYLLKNPNLHDALATLAVISNHEWEILISGRFDGFLWSGAEDQSFSAPTAHPRATSTPLSRTGTPFSTNGGVAIPPSRGQTPFSNPSGGPVALDEETEIAVLNEVEREIFLGMEALEDAFESLHTQAQSVRRALQERSAGLAMSARARRGSSFHALDGDGDDVRAGTPASVTAAAAAAADGADENADSVSLWARALEERSELAPDDSASNIGWRRREEHRDAERRKRRTGGRRNERRTPAPVDEEDEFAEESPRRR